MYTFNQNCISSHAASCTNKPSEILESEEIILFNNHDSIYKNGEFTLSKGIYNVFYNVNIDGTECKASASCGLLLNGIVVYTSIMPNVTGQLSGSAKIKATRCNSKLSLINTSGEQIALSIASPQADILITKL